MALNIKPLSTKEEQTLSKATILTLMKMINASPLIERISYSIDQENEEMAYLFRGDTIRQEIASNRIHLELKVDFIIDMKAPKADLVQFIISDAYKRSIQF